MEYVMKSGEQPKPVISGIYSIAEAARYAQGHPNTVRAWFRADGGRSVFSSDYSGTSFDSGLSFHDLIDVFVAVKFREKGISLQHIKRAYSVLQQDLGSPHPFCHRKLFTGGKRIYVKLDDALFDAVSRQGFSEEVIRRYLEEIDYDEVSSLAERWRIARGVVIDPEISLGKPVIKDTGVTTFVLARSYFAHEEDARFVGEIYDVRTEDVINAVSFEKKYGVVKAAA